MKQVNQELVDNVNGIYQMITQELSKPQEDVVEFSVCIATKSALHNVLKLYLQNKDVDTSQAKSIDDLVQLSLKQNDKFGSFDFASLNCRCEHTEDQTMSYCLGEERINSCYRLLVEVKDFVYSELKVIS